MIEFYLKAIEVAVQFLERCRTDREALQQLVITSPRSEGIMIVRIHRSVEDLSLTVLAEEGKYKMINQNVALMTPPSTASTTP